MLSTRSSQPRRALQQRVRSLVQQLLEAARAGEAARWLTLDLTMPQLKLLFLLDRVGPVSMSDVAARLQIGLSAATGVVDRLEQQGLAHRESNPCDRRVVLVSGTEAGRQLLAGLRPFESEQLDRILDQVNLADLECCARAFDAIHSAAARVAAVSPDRERESRPTELPAGGAAKEAR